MPVDSIDDILETWRRSEARGRRCWGLVCADSVLTQTVSNGLDDPLEALRDLLVQSPSETKRILGNRRGEPTTEWVRGGMGPGDIQPYTSPSGRWVFVHNGTIANDKHLIEIYGHEGQTAPTEIDSYAIGLALDVCGFELTVTRKLVGSFAILAMNVTGDPETLWFATNYKPLFVKGSANGSVIQLASQREYLGHSYNAITQPSVQEIPCYSFGRITPGGIDLHPLQPIPTQRKVLAVCSGGLDSSYAAYVHDKLGDHVTLFHLQYGCKAEGPEVAAVEALAKELDIPAVFLQTDFFSKDVRSVLTDATLEINHARGGIAGAELAHEWVPARNTVMLSLALAYAEKHGYNVIALGNNLEEAGAYPDNEQEFINKFQALVPYAVKAYHQLQFSQPAGTLMKAEIVEFGTAMGMPWHLTWSCYSGGEVHCGTCGPCSMRRTAFKMAGVEDPTVYMEE